MADPEKVYRDIKLNVGFGLYPTNFQSSVLEVQTENDISRYLISFPSSYSDYTMFIDVYYTGSDLLTHVDTYGLLDIIINEISYKYFIAPRYITFGDYILLQCRGRYPYDLSEDPQEIVDPYIIRINLKKSIKTSGFNTIDNLPSPVQSEILAYINDIATSMAVPAVSGFSGYYLKTDGISMFWAP